MRILTRYVLREFLVPLGYCLAGFVSIYVLFELFGSFARMTEGDLTCLEVVRYFCGYLAPYFHYLAPAALMLATLYTMWCFCRHSEIIAMRASGVSFMTIVKPLLATAVGLAIFVAWVNESYVPRNAQWASLLKTAKFDAARVERGSKIVFRNAHASRTWNVDSFGNDEATQLLKVKVSQDRPNSGARILNVEAERVEYLDGEWWFHHPKVQHFNEQGQEVATTMADLESLPLRCFAEFREKPSDFQMQNRPWRFNSVRDRFRFLRHHPELSEEVRKEMLYDTWAQLFAPLACLIITLFAIPAGIASGRQSVFKGILGALGMFFAFYGLTIACMVVSKNGLCPPLLGALLPDVVFLALGVRAFCKQR